MHLKCCWGPNSDQLKNSWRGERSFGCPWATVGAVSESPAQSNSEAMSTMELSSAVVGSMVAERRVKAELRSAAKRVTMTGADKLALYLNVNERKLL